MNLASSYAKALFSLIEQNPKGGTLYLANLNKVLKHRGHEKLLPRVFSEYRTLELKQKRNEMHKHVTPEQEQTRTLLELYRTLIASK